MRKVFASTTLSTVERGWGEPVSTTSGKRRLDAGFPKGDAPREIRRVTLDEVLRATSRTFAIGIGLLPEPLRDEVRVAYLVLRVSDFLEDNRAMDAERKVELLHRWAGILEDGTGADALAEELDRVEDPLPDLRAVRHLEEIHAALRRLPPEAQEVVVRHTKASTEGMACWVERGPRFATEADLDDYMHEVAGRVGHLLTELFALRSPAIEARRVEMMGLGREFGLALQTVNVIRGLHEDHRRGWLFVPRSFLEEAGFVRGGEEVFEPTREDSALALLELLCSKAERHFESARAYVRAIPRREYRMRVFCLLPLLFGVRTLALSRGNPAVFSDEVKMRRDEVKAITRRTLIFAGFNTWVDRYARSLLDGREPRGAS